jgi:hypothetical protein
MLTCTERKFYPRLLLEYTLVTEPEVALYLILLAAPVLGYEAIPKQKEVLFVGLMLENNR